MIVADFRITCKFTKKNLSGEIFILKITYFEASAAHTSCAPENRNLS